MDTSEIELFGPNPRRGEVRRSGQYDAQYILADHGQILVDETEKQ
jgi:hypothetical protein